MQSHARRNQSIGHAALGSPPAALLGFAAYRLLREYHSLGFRNDTQRIRAVLALALCGAAIAVAVINWGRVANAKKLLSLWWIAAAFVGFFLFFPP